MLVLRTLDDFDSAGARALAAEVGAVEPGLHVAKIHNCCSAVNVSPCCLLTLRTVPSAKCTQRCGVLQRRRERTNSAAAWKYEAGEGLLEMGQIALSALHDFWSFVFQKSLDSGELVEEQVSFVLMSDFLRDVYGRGKDRGPLVAHANSLADWWAMERDNIYLQNLGLKRDELPDSIVLPLVFHEDAVPNWGGHSGQFLQLVSSVQLLCIERIFYGFKNSNKTKSTLQ